MPVIVEGMVKMRLDVRVIIRVKVKRPLTKLGKYFFFGIVFIFILPSALQVSETTP